MSNVNSVKARAAISIESGTCVGHYQILGSVGAGGMGRVYRALDLKLGRPVAIKTLPARFYCDEARLRQFEQEARALSSINHPNIVTLYALEDPDDGYYIVMEFVEGCTLRRRLSYERLELGMALSIGTQVASALSAAHSAGIVHRDIKPENVMVRPDGLVKVLDFGLAKLSQPGCAEQPRAESAAPPDHVTLDTAEIQQLRTAADMTSAEATWDCTQILGTTNYMSPEQLSGMDVDSRTDIFSFGVTLYELITGISPFKGGKEAEVINSILELEPAPLNRHCPSIPGGLERIIGKALRKDRARRYQHVSDLLIDLEDVQEDVQEELEPEIRLERSGQCEVIKLATGTESGRPEVSIARRVSAGRNTLYRRHGEFNEQRGKRFARQSERIGAENREAELERKIGQLTMEIDYLRSQLRTFEERQDAAKARGLFTTEPDPRWRG